MKTFRHLDLFSGIGGFALACRMVGGIETIGFCERDKYCKKILAKHWPNVPICDDIHKMKGDEYGTVDIITGGYPCQPFSYAGERKGDKDDRHLWPELRRVVETARPNWCLFENVAGHITMGLDNVLSDLDAIGYTAGTCVIPACAVDAKHRRDRVWIVANSNVAGFQRMPFSWCDGKVRTKSNDERTSRCSSVLADAECRTRKALDDGFLLEEQSCEGTSDGYSDGDLYPGKEWESEPGVGRVAHGIPHRVDRLKGLGNAIVPQVAAEIIRCIVACDADYK